MDGEYKKTKNKLARAVKGLTVEQLEQVIRKQDKAYSDARKEGFSDNTATLFSWKIAAREAKKLRKGKAASTSWYSEQKNS